MVRLDPEWIFLITLVIFAFATWWLRWPLPLTLLAVAAVAGPLAGFGFPFRHLVEGGFGYFNLVLALFAGAFFGQVMVRAGAAEATATVLAGWLGPRRWGAVAIAGALLYGTGMFVGIAGVAVLATGVFVVPLLRLARLPDHEIAAFIAVLATCGMIAPPMNVPAMVIADGVNMPYAKFELTLLALSLPAAIFTVVYFGLRLPPSAHPPRGAARKGRAGVGLASVVLILGFWTVLRGFPAIVPDPAIPLVLVAGAIVALPSLGRSGWQELFRATFSGTPLFLAAVLVTVGTAVQIMALTGIRGWLVTIAMSSPSPWIYAALASIPILGGVLTAMGSSNVLAVPFAFAYIHQDMILNVGALSAIAALAEFCPPTAIAAALASYLVGETRLGRVVRAAVPSMAVIAASAIAVLVFAEDLDAYLR